MNPTDQQQQLYNLLMNQGLPNAGLNQEKIVEETAKRVFQMFEEREQKKQQEEQQRRMETAQKAISVLIPFDIQEQMITDLSKAQRFANSQEVKEIAELVKTAWFNA